ncbi:hypothetical protein HK096_009139, partial [Nowakowskiella sp. JEL0078]
TTGNQKIHSMLSNCQIRANYHCSGFECYSTVFVYIFEMFWNASSRSEALYIVIRSQQTKEGCILPGNVTKTR